MNLHILFDRINIIIKLTVRLINFFITLILQNKIELKVQYIFEIKMEAQFFYST